MTAPQLITTLDVGAGRHDDIGRYARELARVEYLDASDVRRAAQLTEGLHTAVYRLINDTADEMERVLRAHQGTHCHFGSTRVWRARRVVWHLRAAADFNRAAAKLAVRMWGAFRVLYLQPEHEAKMAKAAPSSKFRIHGDE